MPEIPTPDANPDVIYRILEILAEACDRIGEGEDGGIRLAIDGLRVWTQARADEIRRLEDRLRAATREPTVLLQREQPAGYSKEVAEATAALAERRLQFFGQDQIDNSALPAGSRMYYYCQVCGLLAETLPEGWWKRPVKKLCAPCEEDRELLGLIREP